MAGWNAVYIDTKANLLGTKLPAGTTADVTGYDAGPPINRSDPTLQAHYNAAVAAATALLNAMSGPTTKGRCTISGYIATNTSAPVPNAAASRIKIEVVEVW